MMDLAEVFPPGTTVRVAGKGGKGLGTVGDAVRDKNGHAYAVQVTWTKFPVRTLESRSTIRKADR